MEKVIGWFKVKAGELDKWISPKLESLKNPVAKVLICSAVAVLIGLLAVASVAVILLLAFLPLVIKSALFGGILWAVWTYFGLGVQLFPDLNQVYLTLNFTTFFLLTAALLVIKRLFRGPKQTVNVNKTVTNK